MFRFHLIALFLSVLIIIVTEPVDCVECLKSEGGENVEKINCASSCSTLTSYGTTNVGYTVKGCGGDLDLDGPETDKDGCTITDRGDCCSYAGSRECLCRTDLCNKDVTSCGALSETGCNNNLNLSSPCPPLEPCPTTFKLQD